MKSSNFLQTGTARSKYRGLACVALTAILLLGFAAKSIEAIAATRTPITRDQASDNILLCKAGGGEIVRTPSVVACCNEQSDGTTICVGCAPDGSHCANYAVRTGLKNSLRRLLLERSPSSGAVTAPGTSSPPANTRKRLKENRLRN